MCGTRFRDGEGEPDDYPNLGISPRTPILVLVWGEPKYHWKCICWESPYILIVILNQVNVYHMLGCVLRLMMGNRCKIQ